jgi:cytochrome c5
MSPLTRAAVLLLCVSLWAASPPQASAFAEGSGETSPKRERGGGQGAQDPATPLPEGPGQALVTRQCVGCHTLEVALGKRGTADEWRATVQTMIDRGAPITSQDAAAMASYLGQHFGPGASAASAAAAPQSAVSALPDGPGKDVLMKRCFQCHQMSMWSALRQDRKAWEGVIYRMIGRGALWTEDEIRAMADYLARVRGPVQ